jgi:NAD-dependent DNA ligase
LNDNEYDIIKEFVSNKFPNNGIINEIGACVGTRKVKLPYFMGSMDKIKPDTEALNKWKNKYSGPYILSCKLDGVSGLYTTENNVAKLYTRGDGKIGQDISHLIPYLRLPKIKGLVIRGEFILSKSIFETKYKTKFANARNMVAGIINNKTINENIMKDLQFIAYELIKPEKKPSEQIEFLSSLDIEVVFNDYKKIITNEILSDILKYIRYHCLYEIDGIIVTNDSIYKRIIGNPEHSIAFKMILSDQIAEAKVVDVIWAPSKDGYLKPRVQIEPINLGGVCIEYATGFNASFIETNKIGIGAVVEIIRSGDVIPHIQNIVLKAEQAKMPLIPYIWNDTHIDVILENKDLDDTVKEKIITGFFRGIGVEGLSSGNIARIIQAGYNSISKIIQMNIPDFLNVQGFKEKTALKLYNGIKDSLNKANLISLMSASNIFGRGLSDKKIELIMDSIPNILISQDTNTQKINNIISIKGMSLKTAEPFVENINEFIIFMKNIGQEEKLLSIPKKIEYNITHPLFDKIIVMTGFRDTNLQNDIKKVGAKIGTSISKNTFILLVMDLMEETSKAEDARKLEIPIMTTEQFKKKYIF